MQLATAVYWNLSDICVQIQITSQNSAKFGWILKGISGKMESRKNRLFLVSWAKWSCSPKRVSLPYRGHAIITCSTVSLSPQLHCPVGCFPIILSVLFSFLCPILILLIITCSVLSITPCLSCYTVIYINVCLFISFQTKLFPSVFDNFTLISTSSFFTAS